METEAEIDPVSEEAFLSAALVRSTYDVTIVLGGGILPNGTSPVWVERRLDFVYELYRKGTSEYLLMSGWGHNSPPVTEAATMKAGLITRGIPSKDIGLESKSRNTLENFGYSRFAVIESLGLPYLSKIATVTGEFTGPRVDGIAEWVLGPYYVHETLTVPDHGLDLVALATRKDLENQLIDFNERELFGKIEKGDRDRLKAFFYDPEDPLKRRYDEFETTLDLSNALY